MNLEDLKVEVARQRHFRADARPDALNEIRRICMEIMQENSGNKIHLTLHRRERGLSFTVSEVLTLPWRVNPENETEYLDVVYSEKNRNDLEFLLDFADVSKSKDDVVFSPVKDVFPVPDIFEKSGVYIMIAKPQPGYYDD